MARQINLFVILLTLFALSIYSLRGQEAGFRKTFKAAEYYFVNDDYERALPLYEELNKQEPGNFNVAMYLGLCYLYFPEHAEKSVRFLKQASANYGHKIKEHSHREERASIYSIYFLGYAYQLNYQFDEAIAAYDKFLSVCPETDYYADQARAGVVSSLRAKSLMRDIKPCWFENLGPAVNTPFNEAYPCVNRQEDLLVFTRTVEKRASESERRALGLSSGNAMLKEFRIMLSRKAGGQWQQAADITDQLRSNGKFHTLSLSADGSRLYLFRNNYDDGSIEDVDNGAIYISHFSNGQWSPVSKLNRNINTMSWETFAIESEDGNTLYFTSDKLGGQGGLDIYYTQRTGAGDWGPAMPLPGNVNTAFDEASVFPVGDSILYFSSMGHSVIGNLDIFMSRRCDSLGWSEPINMGFPVNSPRDDLYFMPTADGKAAYMAFMRTDGIITLGSSDIYRVELDADEEQLAKVGLDFTKKGPTLLSGFVGIGFENDTAPNLVVKLDNLTASYEAMVDNTTRQFELTIESGTYQLTLHADSTVLYSQELIAGGQEVLRIDLPDIEADDIAAPATDFAGWELLPFSIQLSAKYNPVNIEEYFRGTPAAEYYCTDKLYRYISGSYATQAVADSALAVLRAMGFADAFIVSSERMNRLMGEAPSVSKVFTVQVFSANFSVSKPLLAKIDNASEVRLSEGRYIYISGVFSDFTEAQAHRAKLREMGYTDAFVTNIDRFRNRVPVN
jgi:tetratricopeptide (TPR) repeat protein